MLPLKQPFSLSRIKTATPNPKFGVYIYIHGKVLVLKYQTGVVKERALITTPNSHAY